MINKQKYEEIVSMIPGYCCSCTDWHGHCAEVECNVQMIVKFCGIIWKEMT